VYWAPWATCHKLNIRSCTSHCSLLQRCSWVLSTCCMTCLSSLWHCLIQSLYCCRIPASTLLATVMHCRWLAPLQVHAIALLVTKTASGVVSSGRGPLMHSPTAYDSWSHSALSSCKTYLALNVLKWCVVCKKYRLILVCSCVEHLWCVCLSCPLPWRNLIPSVNALWSSLQNWTRGKLKVLGDFLDGSWCRFLFSVCGDYSSCLHNTCDLVFWQS